MDVCLLSFTQRSLCGHNEILYFSDICAGPGGFSEYVLWRRKYRTKGFGFTIKGPCDFKLEEFFAASPEYFEPHYGEVTLYTLNKTKVIPWLLLPRRYRNLGVIPGFTTGCRATAKG